MRVDVARTAVVIPLPPPRRSTSARWRERVARFVSDESFAETVLVLVTLGLGVVLFVALDQAITLPRPVLAP
jgi:hypothetical protein